MIPFIAASMPGDEMPWRNGVAHVSRANTSWDRTPSATDPRTIRQAVRPANPTTTVAVASPSSGADGAAVGADGSLDRLAARVRAEGSALAADRFACSVAHAVLVARGGRSAHPPGRVNHA